MDAWVINLIIIIIFLVTLFASGIPIAAAFMLFNLIGAFIWIGPGALGTMPGTIFANIATFSLAPVPLFILLGEILFQSGLASEMITVVGTLIGRIRGSLSLVAVGAGVIFGTMSGSSMSGVAVLGSTLVPEMRARGYSKQLSMGPIMASGGLAMIIPPTIIGVLIATLFQVPVGKFLIAGVLPGLLLASLYTGYILTRVTLNPELAPYFAPPDITWRKKVWAIFTLLPFMLIIFLVLGVIFLGVATPSEAAALGAAGALILAFSKGKLSWLVIKKSVFETVKVSSMIFFIMMGSMIFSQILSFAGITGNLVNTVQDLNVHPLVVVLFMQILLLFLGMLVDGISIIMITVPIFLPIITSLHLNPIWFGILFLINMEIGAITPPFGLNLFTMAAVVPDADMVEIYKAAIPYVLLGVVCLAILMVIPGLATWLPSLM